MNNFNAKFLKLSLEYLEEKIQLVKTQKEFQKQQLSLKKSSKISSLFSKFFK